VGDGVWELKTADVRIFGWFPGRDQYIAVRVDQAWRVKESNLYAGYKGEVVRYRDALPLAGDKFVKGVDPNDVVSNFSYP
jgi:hypothetical protein